MVTWTDENFSADDPGICSSCFIVETECDISVEIDSLSLEAIYDQESGCLEMCRLCDASLGAIAGNCTVTSYFCHKIELLGGQTSVACYVNPKFAANTTLRARIYFLSSRGAPIPVEGIEERLCRLVLDN